VAVEDISRVRVIALQSDRKELTRTLQRFGYMDITDISEEIGPDVPGKDDVNANDAEDARSLEEFEKIDHLMGELDYAIKFLQGYDPVKESFIQSFFLSKVLLTPDEHRKAINDVEGAMRTVGDCRSAERGLVELRARRERIRDDLAALEVLEGVKVPLDRLGSTRKTGSYLISVPEKETAAMEADARRMGSHLYLERQSVSKSRTIYMVIHLHDRQKEVEELIRSHRGEHIPYPKSTGTPAEAAARLRLEQDTVEEKIATRKDTIMELIQRKPALQALYDHLLARRDRHTITDRYGSTARTLVVDGWVPKDRMGDLQTRLEGPGSPFQGRVAILERPPREDEPPPVVLKNKKYLKPIEVIVNVYGQPRYMELDPTPWLAPFFLIFFPLCLSDAGYGILLAILSIYMLKKVQMGPEGAKLFRLLAVCGVLTIPVGALFGSWFGLDADFLGAHAPFLLKFQVLDMINNKDDLLFFMKLALFLGAAQVIYAGRIAAMVNARRQGQFARGVAENCIVLYFSTAFIFWTVATFGEDVGPTVSGWAPDGFYLYNVLAGVALTIGYGAVTSRGASRLFSGVGMVYNNIFGSLGDILSYTRLVALGLSTAIIALVFNILGFMLIPEGGGIWYVLGIIGCLMIMIVGHLFNLIISALGAFVHSIRLQYVEFFTKFFQGGGRVYAPFKVENRFTEVRDDPAATKEKMV